MSSSKTITCRVCWWLNLLVFQWFFFRVYRHHFVDKGIYYPDGWAVLIGVVPMTGLFWQWGSFWRHRFLLPIRIANIR